jgi:hypothetical protein
MPSSLIVVALVVAWLVVLVPMIVRKRQEIARTADSALAARVVRSGDAEDSEEGQVHEEELDADQTEPYEEPPMEEMTPAGRRYRPGRGGFDPEAAAVIAKAKYGFRQRVVLAMLVGAVVTAVLGGMVFPLLWWAHVIIDFTLVSYLVYLRRQVRIEQEIRERRLARMGTIRRSHARPHVPEYEEVAEPELEPERRHLVTDDYPPQTTYHAPHHPGAAVVDLDDEDPAFDELDPPGNLPYRRAVGE